MLKTRLSHVRQNMGNEIKNFGAKARSSLTFCLSAPGREFFYGKHKYGNSGFA